MKHQLLLVAPLLGGLAPALFAAETPPALKNPKPLFDGRTLAGWEGDTKIWRVEDGCLTGGSLTETVKQNEFLASTRDYTNFILRFKIKLTGTNGFINSGFQIRSQRVPNNSEMAGYQCDFGEPNWYGAIYDESRRNKLMASSDMKALRPVIKHQDWNDYVIRADGSRITTWINRVMGVDYHEPDLSIPNYDWGRLGIQVHGGGKAVVQVKDIFIEELPTGKRFIGAPEPKGSAQHNEGNRAAAQTAGKAEPVAPEVERARFSLPPGFEIELVAAEDIEAGIGKFVAVDWDLQGRLWTMTALEYPVDANEGLEVAKALYASHAKDKVLVYDRDPRSPTGYASKPRVFADGLAIPLGILPYKNSVYVQHGPDIVFLSDTDGDGKADQRDVILTGFGVQDSHLFPHQFTRAPGNWIWMAQGAFNYGKVKTTRGAEVQFDQTRMARFRYDGSDFEITSQGPCNIWGLHMTMEGETWIQEANDYGYPAMPFHEYANYPGCSQAQWKSYAPEFPGTAPHFAMGGTGLSGLAISDRSFWPEPYADVIYVANPITRKIQAIRAERDGPRWKLNLLPDFVLSEDEMFRPVALRLGPDGCLYIVDWYNKIISHNEVPRNHPERDKKRGRIWRVKHKDTKPLEMADFTKLAGDDLVAKLGGGNTTQSHLAWQAITDRQLTGLAPTLKDIVGDASQSATARIAALWALEGLGRIDLALLQPMVTETNRNLRREAVRAFGSAGLLASAVRSGRWPVIHELELFAFDRDPDVRAEVIRVLGTVFAMQPGAAPVDAPISPANRSLLGMLVTMAGEPLAEPTAKSTHNGRVIKTGAAYEREFERYLIRFFLERQPRIVSAFLETETAKSLHVESRLLATLALEPKASATRVARLLPQLTRPPSEEEILRLAQFPEDPGVSEALQTLLQSPTASVATLQALLKARTRIDAAKIAPLAAKAARRLLAQQDNFDGLQLGARLASAFRLAELEPDLARVLEWDMKVPDRDRDLKRLGLTPQSEAALRALRELKSGRVDLFASLAEKADPAGRQLALAALAESRDERGPQRLLELFGSLNGPERRAALGALAGGRTGAQALVKSVRGGGVAKDEIDGATFDKLQAVLGDDAELASLMQEMASLFRPVLRLNGEDNAWTETGLTLDGPFTVETWAKLDPGIDNNDGILGVPGALDMNFFAGQFRVWVGGEMHDAIVGKKKTVADAWTHVAVTRDARGMFRIYQNGELDTADSKPAPQTFENVRLGWTAPGKGTAGWLSEFRIWNRERSAAEIRADFDRSFDKVGQASRLPILAAGAGETPALLFTGTNWGKLHGGAKVMKSQDFPPLLTPAEAEAVAEKFRRFQALAEKQGDTAKGEALFAATCQQCHTVAGQGGQVGPVLNGAGALGVETLLRNLLTPNAAMEPGYRVFRVELKDGDVLDGIRVSEDKEAIVLRRPNLDDARIPQKEVRKAGFTKSSMMPEGLLDALHPEQVSDLFAYLKSLR
jgi:putative membrane-bound dehydrogenase-like protein